MTLNQITKVKGPGIHTLANIVSNTISLGGIATASNFKTGTTNVHNVGVEAAGINVLGADTPIGTGATIYDAGGAVFTGVVTATSFSGSVSGTADLASGLTGTPDIAVRNITGVGATFTGNVSIGGTLTYEDVTNIDSVGLVTARTGVVSPYADIDDWIDVGSNIKLGNAGVITATSFSGSGANLTGIDATALKDSGGNVKIQAQASGAMHTGVSTITQKLVVGSGNNINSTALINTGDVDIDALTLSNWDGSTTTNKVTIHFDSSGRGGWNIGMPAATDAFVIEDDGGTEKLRITSGGHIVTQGLSDYSFNNDSSNAKILEVTGDGTVGEYGVVTVSSNQNADASNVGTLRFVNRENSNSSSGNNAGSKQVAAIQAYLKTSDTNAGDDSGGWLSFFTKNESAVNAEALRITQAGTVNIGGSFTQTTYKARILTASNKTISFGNAAHDDLSNEGAGIFFSRQNDGAAELSGLFAHSNGGFGIATRENMTFHTGGGSTYGAAVERMRIASDGQLQVKADNSTSHFSVANSSGTMTILDTTEPSAVGVGGRIVFGSKYYNSSNTMAGAFIGQYKHEGPSNGVGEYRHHLTFGTRNENDGLIERMRISHLGKVGIGSASPAGMLEVMKNGVPAIISNYNNQKHISMSVGGSGGGWAQTTGNHFAWTHQPYADRGTDNNLSEKMRITSDGKLLVGATAATSGGIAEFHKEVGAGAEGCHILVRNTSTNSVNNTARVKLQTSGGTAQFFAYAAPETYLTSRTGGTANLMLLADGASRMRMYTNGNERFTIESDGNIAFGENPDGTLWDATDQSGGYYRRDQGSFASASRSNTGYSAYYINKNTGSGTSDYRWVDFYWDSTQRGRISYNGSGGTNYGTSSDYRLKENVVSITDGIAKVKQLKPYRFNFKSDTTDKVVQGFFAHEVQDVIPYAVSGTKDEVVTQEAFDEGSQPEEKSVGEPIYQDVDYAKLTPILTAALQEAVARIEVLESKNSEIESKNSELTTLLDELKVRLDNSGL